MEKDNVYETGKSMAETYTKASSCLENLFGSLNRRYFGSMLG